MLYRITFLMMMLLVFGCSKKGEPDMVSGEETTDTIASEIRFSLMNPEETGVTFVNQLEMDHVYNIFTYEYMFNGGGVAVGDVNGDSLPDLYFSATLSPNRLYINRGNFKFEDVTEIAGVQGVPGFKTGVMMADLNGDNRMDIYSCRTSKTEDFGKDDFVYINKGNKEVNGMSVPVFEESAAMMGLKDNTNTNNCLALDYDRDGDLDVMLLNHRLGFTEAQQLRLQQNYDGTITRLKTPMSPYESNRLYRNDGGKFVDVTEKAGLITSAFGLSATATDINKDGWIDIYVANDYVEPDMIFINNKNGTFTDRYQEFLSHSSQNSMGADIADINNDGLLDIMVLDMKAEDPVRYKKLMHTMHYDRYNLLVKYGYGRQVGRNVLQVNNGNNTFMEIGQFAGVAATDWSWGILMADFDNDGWKDIHVSNGYRKDVTEMDYFNFTRDSLNKVGSLTKERFPDLDVIMNLIPEQKIPNYFYLNNKDLKFQNATAHAGVDQPSFSNGSAYADLDRDGDLDLIINNINEPPFLYRNEITGKQWIQIDPQGPPGNHEALGAVAEVYVGNEYQYGELLMTRGFFSSSEPLLHFGLGDHQMIDSIILTWPLGTKEIMRNVKPNQRIIWTRGMGNPYKASTSKKPEPLFAKSKSPEWIHEENEFVDFKTERMIPYMLSMEGPCMSVGDINGDKLDDIFVGNGAGFPGAVFEQKQDGSFIKNQSGIFESDKVFEDCGSILEDFDGDQDIDILVISGGNSFTDDLNYISRLYLNDGAGNFSRSSNFPIVRTNAGSALALDYDGDQDLDIFIGGRSKPGAFPLTPKSYVLKNDAGRFTDVTEQEFSGFSEVGMVTDLEKADLTGDGKDDLIVSLDWGPVKVFSVTEGIFKDVTEQLGLTKWTGLWRSVTAEDLDDDGDTDLIVGNIGLNHRMHTSSRFPVTLISKDFDGNGSQDPIMAFYHNGKLFPYAGRDAIIGQIPKLKKKYVKYGPYANATIQDIFGEELEGSLTLTVNTFETMCLMNNNGTFSKATLPFQVQLSPTQDIIVRDFNQDGKKDMLLAGNFLYSETETGEMDAGKGVLLLQESDGSFRYADNREHGFWAQKEVRELEEINLANGKQAIITGNNKGPLEIHILQKQSNQIQ